MATAEHDSTPQSDAVLRCRAQQLAAVRFGSAPAWNPAAAELLLDYYARVLPFWPADSTRALPSGGVIARSIFDLLPGDALARVERETDAVAVATRSAPPSRTSLGLIKIALASAVLVDRGILAAEADPGVPVVALFQAGFDLSPHHGGVDLIHVAGFTTVPLPTREASERRASR